MDYDVKDLDLAREGKLRMEWAGRFMPVLNDIKSKFQEEKPLQEQVAVVKLCPVESAYCKDISSDQIA